MWLPAAVGSALVFGIGGFLLKVSSHKQYAGGSIFTGLYLTGSSIFFLMLLMSQNIVITPQVLLFSVVIGSGSFFSNLFLVKAYDHGPATLTSPLVNLSIVLVILLSTIVYEENITLWQGCGITCMVAAVTLLGMGLAGHRLVNPMWILFVILAITFVFMREGGLKVAHESGMNNVAVLLFGYLFAGSLAVIRLFYDSRTNEIGKPRPCVKALLLGGSIGVFSSIGLILLTYAIAHGPASLIVPIFSTRNFVVVILILIFFKEKLTLLQWMALGLLLFGITLIQF
jgi:drug/metabolite transporter (DMT)-like permease